MIRRIINSLMTIGLWQSFQKLLQKIIGVSDIQIKEREEIQQIREELDSLHYFLNMFHEVSTVPPATDPDLRIMQLCDTELLRVVTHECDRLGLTYWLDFGTLLGAVRHNGFIPWDDDVDIAMPRNDYNQALTQLKDILMSKDLDFEETDRIGIGYKHKMTGIWIDIFAVDTFNTEQNYEDVKNSLSVSIPKYREVYKKNIERATVKWRSDQRDLLIGGKVGDKTVLYHQPEFFSNAIVHSSECVYPLSQMFFEGIPFNVPNNTDVYLRSYYGNNYMDFPRGGVLHHDLGRGTLSTWARKNGIDMKEILKELKDIH